MTEQKRLLTHYINGDIKSMEKLVEEYKDDLYNLCFRMTFSRFEADDLFQQTWEKAIKNAARFNGKSFRNWLYTICINTYRDSMRKNERRKKIGGIDFKNTKEKEIAMSLVSDGITAEDTALERQTRIKLAGLVNCLPEKQKSAVVLHYYQGLSYEETAGILNIPQGTVKSRLSAAKRKLKTKLAPTAQGDGSAREEELYAKYS
jgi:RNA polymerase sigma-70 factor (ECF subfamily)